LRLQAWSNIRADIAEQLRLPLCLALLKNCTSPYDEAYSLVSSCRAHCWSHASHPSIIIATVLCLTADATFVSSTAIVQTCQHVT
jgi:hypothetical protein